MTAPSALVTGAASGIGAEVARRLHRRGYRILALDRTPEEAAQAASLIGPESVAVPCDLTDPSAVAGVCERIATEWRDDLQVLICNAGIIVPGELSAAEPAVVDAQLDVMLRSPLQMIRAALPGLLEHNKGHILATVSMGGIIPLAGSATYSAAKAGLRASLAALHAELKHTDVRVSGIYPSAVDTPMLRHEAKSGGSPLNFVGAVQSIDRVAGAFERALDSGRLETYVPWSDSLGARFALWTPAIIPWVTPVLNWLGERGRTKYLRRVEQGGAD